jgi:hypothetical protein
MTENFDDVPPFILQDMPILESDERSVVVGPRSLGSDYSSPYPPIAKVRSSSSHSHRDDVMIDHGHNQAPGNSFTTPGRVFSGYTEASMGSSPTSYHTANSSGIASNYSPYETRSSPFVPDNTPGTWKQGSSSRGNTPIYYKQPGSMSGYSSSPLNSTPQYIMKYSRRPDVDDSPSMMSRYRSPQNQNDSIRWVDPMNRQQQTPVPIYPTSVNTPASTTISVSSSPPSITRSRGSDVNLVVTSPTSVPWRVTDPAEWPVERVLYWLESNRFGPDWIEAFKAKNIHGEYFLSLTSYQNFKKLGHMPTSKTDDYDNSPSRFIHILRKMLNKSNSNQSSEGLPLALEFADQLQHQGVRMVSAEQPSQNRPIPRLQTRSRSTGEMTHDMPGQQPYMDSSFDSGATEDDQDTHTLARSSTSTLVDSVNSMSIAKSAQPENQSFAEATQQSIKRPSRLDLRTPNYIRPYSTVETVSSKPNWVTSGLVSKCL